MMNSKNQARIALGILISTLSGCATPIAGGTAAAMLESVTSESNPGVTIAKVEGTLVADAGSGKGSNAAPAVHSLGARPIRPSGFQPLNQEDTPVVIASVGSFANDIDQGLSARNVASAPAVSEAFAVSPNMGGNQPKRPNLPEPVMLDGSLTSAASTLAGFNLADDEEDKATASDKLADEKEQGDAAEEDDVDVEDDVQKKGDDKEDGDEEEGDKEGDDKEEEEASDIESEVLQAVQPTGSQPLTVTEAVRIALSRNKGIMVLGYVPQEVGTFISTEQAAFDPVFNANLQGGKLDRQLANFIESGGIIDTNEQQTDIIGPLGDNVLSITKLLESGGTIEAGVGTNYLFQDPIGNFIFLNPAWGSSINFRISQPLLRGFGRDVTTAPLRIAQAGRNEAVHDFQASVNAILRDVEQAYWDWKLAAQQYEVRKAAVKQAGLTVEQEKEALDLGESTVPDVEQALDQAQRFQIDAMLAKNDLRQARIRMIQLMGLSSYEAQYDFAIDMPEIDVPVERELGEATALSRPEVMAAQSRIRQIELAHKIACDNMKPELAVFFDYSVTGMENRLDDSIGTVFDNRFNDWIVGFDYRRAAGLRAEYAQLRRTRLQLARARAEQDQIEFDILTEVAAAYETVVVAREALEIQRLRVDTARKQVDGRDELYKAGEGTLDQKVRAEESLVEALLGESASEIALRQALVNWQYVTNQQSFVQYTNSQ